MVRLLPTVSLMTLSSHPFFQSHNGAIAAMSSWRRAIGMSNFQSHNGAIAAKANEEIRRDEVIAFNPTMVRLLPSCHSWVRVVGIFQSHNGAIAAYLTMPRLVNPNHFQSHNGAIAAWHTSASMPSATLLSIPQWCDCCRDTPVATRIC